MRTLIALAVISVGTLVLPVPAEAQDTISLRFAWPERVTARVEAQRIRARLAEDRMDSVVVAVTYTMRGEPHPEGRVIRYSDFLFGDLAERLEADARMMLDRAVAMVPGLIVSDEGEFVRLEDVASLRAQLDTLLEPIVRELPTDERGAETLASIRNMVTDEALEASAADEWNTIVGHWLDADLELGAEYAYEAVAPFPILPGVTLRYEHQFAVTRRVPCTETSSAESCVEVVMFSAPDPDATAEVMERFYRQITRSAEETDQPIFDELLLEDTVTLVLEPATLLPHSVTIARQVSGRSIAPGEPEQEFYQVDLRSWRYLYGK